MSLSQGDRLGRYEILGLIGTGGMGEVWRARDTELDRQVAIKVLPEAVAAEPRRVERFRREGRALAALSHPNLLEIHDVGATDGLNYVVTELLEGDSLRAMIPPSGLPWKRVAKIGAAVSDGLAAAHSKGIVHRDLKPENVFVTADGRVKILDLGLANFDEEERETEETVSATPTLTEEGAVLGTMGYMAPEQLRGRPADARSDVFALGCVLYEMVSGRRAFSGDTGIEVAAAILKEEPPQLSSSGSAVPVDLERTVHRCLEKRPEARFQSAADLAYNLRSLSSSSSTPIMATPSSITSMDTSRQPWWLALVVIFALILAVVTSWWLFNRDGGEQQPIEVASSLDTNRIAVVPFSNQSGDEGLDALGRRGADRVMKELADVEELQVAPASVVAGIAQGRAPLGSESRALVHDIATTTSSRLVVVGVIYAPGEEIEIQASLEDAVSGRTVRSFDTLRCPRNEIDTSLNTLAGWVFITAMEELHPSLRFGAGDHIPDPVAFREFLTALPIAGIDPAAYDHFLKALDLDPGFDRIRLYGAIALWSIGDWQRADQLLRPLEESRGKLAPSQQRLLDAARWGLDGRWFGALGILQEYLADNPDDCMARAAVIKTAMYSNRPRLALEVFQDYRWDPVQPANQMKIVYFLAAHAHHQLAQHEQELAVLRTLWEEHRSFFGTIWFRANEVAALAALGRVDECHQVIADALTEPSYGPTRYGGLMVGTAMELRAHGHSEESRSMAQRALDWFEDAELPAKHTQQVQEDTIAALALLGHHEQAYRLATERLAGEPDSWPLQAKVGVLAARADDRATAEEMSRKLAAIDAPFTMGWPSYNRAAIAAQLGERDSAIRLLQQAITQGFRGHGNLHVDIDFDPIRDDPEFQEIQRPKG